MRVEVLKSFTHRDSETGKLTAYTVGDVLTNLSDDLAENFIESGLVKRYVTLGVAGAITITENGTYSVEEYLSAVVKVEDFQNFIAGSLTSITADMLAGMTSIPNEAFYYKSALTSVEIPNSVTSIGEKAFYSCKNLESVTFPNSVTSIGKMAFYDCAFTSLTIPDSVTTIEMEAFWHCTSLESVTLPNSVTIISPETFQSCRSLTNITIPSSVVEIGANTFNGCRSLTSITIPSSVTNIKYQAFYDCSSLASVTMLPTTPPTLGSEAVFRNTSDNLVIYVPAESVNAYKSASVWSNYSSKIQAIQE